MHPRRRILTIAALLLLAALSAMDHAGVFGYRGNDRLRYHCAETRIIRVINARTMEIAIGDGTSATSRVRLLGVGPVDSGAAKRFVVERFAEGPIRLFLDPDHRTRDHDGCLMAYVYPDDEVESINEALVREGVARDDPDDRCALSHRLSELRRRADKYAAQSKPRP